MARVMVEVPEEVAALLRREPLLRLAISEAVRREVMDYLTTILILDKLTRESRLDEESIKKLDKMIKEGVREKWDAESRGRH